MRNLKKEVVSIFAHDIGAANHIFSWIDNKDLTPREVYFCLAGPAKQAFLKLGTDFPLSSFSEAFEKGTVILTGTGWGSNLEFDALKRAKDEGIETISVVDNWISFKSDKNRFIRKNLEVLPNQIWTISEEIKKEICGSYENISVVVKENSYLKNQVLSIDVEKIQSYLKILFLMEPRGKRYENPEVLGEFKAFDYFLSNIDLLTLNQEYQIIIKPHPSDEKGKYSSLLKKENFNIQVDENSELSDLITWANIVVGMESYAMRIALESGRRVYSSLPPGLEITSLRDSRVIRLSELNNEA